MGDDGLEDDEEAAAEPDLAFTRAQGGADGDAGREGAEDEEQEHDGEAQQPLRRSSSTRPTTAELRAHRVSHLPFRDWCPECVAGRAKDWPHRQNKEVEQLAVPEVNLDYCFLRDEAGEEYSVVLVGKDRETKLMLAHVVPMKGGTSSGSANRCART